MLGIFKIKKDEWPMVLSSFIIMAALNVMMVYYKFEAFTQTKYTGFWTIFADKLGLSGFDTYPYVILSKWNPVYPIYRHPVLSVLLYPFSMLNSWLTPLFGINCATSIIAAVWTVMNTFSFLFLYRVMRHGIGLKRMEAMLMNLFFLSMAYIMLTMIVPEHMTITFFLLSMTLWISTQAIIKNKPIKRWKTMVLAFFSTAVTTTSISKIVIADAITLIRRCSIKGFIRKMLWYIVPLTAVIAAVAIQEVTTEKAERDRNAKIEATHRAKNPEKYDKEKAAYEQRKAKAEEKQSGGGELFAYTDKSIDPVRSVTENMFGEAMLLHEDHLLEDVYHGRPVFVTYKNAINYVVIAAIALAMIAGAWIGRRNRVIQIALGWFAIDFILHIVLAFAINEVYIMTAHWAFVIPLTIACLIAKARTAAKPYLYNITLCGVIAVTAYMLIHNCMLLIPYMLHL